MSGALDFPAQQRRISFTPAYRNYVFGILLAIIIFNFTDRSMLSIFLQPIKLDLQYGIASDWLVPVYGDGSMRYALTGVSLVSVLAMAQYYFAGFTLRQDLDENPGRQPREVTQ